MHSLYRNNILPNKILGGWLSIVNLHHQKCKLRHHELKLRGIVKKFHCKRVLDVLALCILAVELLVQVVINWMSLDVYLDHGGNVKLCFLLAVPLAGFHLAELLPGDDVNF